LLEGLQLAQGEVSLPLGIRHLIPVQGAPTRRVGAVGADDRRKGSMLQALESPEFGIGIQQLMQALGDRCRQLINQGDVLEILDHPTGGKALYVLDGVLQLVDDHVELVIGRRAAHANVQRAAVEIALRLVERIRVEATDLKRRQLGIGRKQCWMEEHLIQTPRCAGGQAAHCTWCDRQQRLQSILEHEHRCTRLLIGLFGSFRR